MKTLVVTMALPTLNELLAKEAEDGETIAALKTHPKCRLTR